MFDRLFDEKGLSLDRLRRFLAVVESGGNTKAAGGDPTLQSQISRQIKELETFFGVSLFLRVGKRMQPTDKGRLLAVIARHSLSSLEDFRIACAQEPRTISIGAGDAFFQWVLLPRIGELEEGDVTLHIENLRTREIAEQVTDMRLDFGVVREDAISASHESRKLGKLGYALFVPRKLVGMSKVAVWKTLLSKVPLATLETSGQFFERLNEAAKEAGIELQLRLACSSFPQAAKALETGRFAAILPKIAQVELSKDDYAQVPVPFLSDEMRELHLIWNRRQMHMQPELEKFLTRIAKLLAIK